MAVTKQNQVLFLEIFYFIFCHMLLCLIRLLLLLLLFCFTCLFCFSLTDLLIVYHSFCYCVFLGVLFVCVSVYLSHALGFCCLFVFICLFDSGRERETRVGLLGTWGELGRRNRKAKHDQNIFYKKKFSI